MAASSIMDRLFDLHFPESFIHAPLVLLSVGDSPLPLILGLMFLPFDLRLLAGVPPGRSFVLRHPGRDLSMAVDTIDRIFKIVPGAWGFT